MRIDVWSDVVCPWCYIGKRRLEKALADFEHGDEVEVVWRSFLLDPGAPQVPTENAAEAIGRKYGVGPEGGQKMIDQVEAVAAEEGLLYRLGKAQRVGTVDAHRLLHFAFESGGAALQGALKERLLSAYFIESVNVADHDNLADLAAEVGLDRPAVVDVLKSDRFQQAVWDDIDAAQSMGASGVPFIVAAKYAVSGAQPPEMFAQLLQRAWEEQTPVRIDLSDTNEHGCHSGGCEI